MSSDYFTFSNRMVEHTAARGTALNEIFDQIEAGLDKLPDTASLTQGLIGLGSDSGTVNAYVITLSPVPASYVNGMNVFFQAANANTGASTVDVNSLGAKAIKRPNGADPGPGDISAGGFVSLRYDAAGGVFQLITPAVGDLAATAASAAAAASSASNAATQASAASASASGAASSAAAAASSATEAAGYAAAINLPAIQSGDAGKFLAVKEDETGWELGSQPKGWKNYLINSRLDIWRRGVSFSPTSSEYGPDRIVIASGGTGVITATRQDFTPGQTDVPGEPVHYLRIVRSTSNGDYGGIHLRIEDVRTLAGQDAVFSCYWKGSGAVSLRAKFFQNFGPGGSETVVTNGTPYVVDPGTGWSRMEATVSLPSIAGKTIGTDSMLEVRIEQNYWSGTVEFAQLQLERGAAATEYEHRPLAIELPMCQRYYQRLNLDNDHVLDPAARHASATIAVAAARFAQEMRAAPAISVGSASQFAIYGTHGNVNASGFNASGATPTGARLEFTTVSGLTPGEVSDAYANTNGAYVEFDAEL